MKKLWKTIGVIIGISAVLSVVASIVVRCCKTQHREEITERTYTTIE
ncbi:hypothetical protein IMX26_07015 [Clostridium sp. 'deep sea']|nr:hypothetical protein [Clostridium sp. 'deep sea']QOR36552.1 hypothetical protein IMX26_07015 [Clostridium sp. 'deep sea']